MLVCGIKKCCLRFLIRTILQIRYTDSTIKKQIAPFFKIDFIDIIQFFQSIGYAKSPICRLLSAYWGLVFVLHQCAFAWCKVLCRFFKL